MFDKGGMGNHLVVDVVRQELTRELARMIEAIQDETAYTLRLLFMDDTGWSSQVTVG